MQTRPDRTLGPDHDTFWDYAAKGELRLQRCHGCGTLLWPAVHACTACGGGEFTWELMSGRGRLASWCAFHQDYYRGLLPLPWETILVELEEGPLFISNPDGFTLAEARLDMPVTLAFVDAEDRAGRYALPVFRAA